MIKVHTYPVSGNPQSSGEAQATVPNGSQARISCEPIVANNLDKLKISFWLHWKNGTFLDQLETVKKQAQSGDDDSLPFSFKGYDWNIHRSGTSRYNYRLTRGDIVLLFNRREHTGKAPTAALEVGSMSCWSPGYREIYNTACNMLLDLDALIIKECVSEIHLCADILGVSVNNIPITIQDHWICRAHRFTPEYYRKKLTGVSLGKGNMMLRIYDKVEELKKDSEKSALFYSIWGIDPLDELPVTRFEFQLRRPALIQFQGKINTLNDLENHLASIWEYCSQAWARLTLDPVDRNHHQSRSTDHPTWKLVQSASWDGNYSVIRQQQKFHKDSSRLGKQFLGLGMTLASLADCPVDDVEAISTAAHSVLEERIRALYKENHHEFVKRMKRKKNQCLSAFPSPQWEKDDDGHYPF